MLDYASLNAVAHVVREGSFERAAAKLNMTPSAVSQRVRNLEERLGTILIVRGQPCKATELGRKICAHHDRVELLEADLNSSLGSEFVAEHHRLPLRLAVNSDSLATWFPKAAARFAEQGQYTLDFTVEDEAVTAERLKRGEVVAAVSTNPGELKAAKTIELGVMDNVACCSPEFYQRYFADKPLEEALNIAPHLHFDRYCTLPERWVTHVTGQAISAPRHILPSVQGFRDFTLEGIAWGIQPRAYVAQDLRAGRLVEIVPDSDIQVQLFWTVLRLHAATLKPLTEAVKWAFENHRTAAGYAHAA